MVGQHQPKFPLHITVSKPQQSKRSVNPAEFGFVIEIDDTRLDLDMEIIDLRLYMICKFMIFFYSDSVYC